MFHTQNRAAIPFSIHIEMFTFSVRRQLTIHGLSTNFYKKFSLVVCRSTSWPELCFAPRKCEYRNFCFQICLHKIVTLHINVYKQKVTFGVTFIVLYCIHVYNTKIFTSSIIRKCGLLQGGCLRLWQFYTFFIYVYLYIQKDWQFYAIFCAFPICINYLCCVDAAVNFGKVFWS